MAGARLWLIGVIGVQVFTWITAARYTCSSSKSSYDIDASIPGEIISTNFPANYANDQDCSWKLKAPLGSVVRIKIKSFHLEQYDFLTISDGETQHGGNLIANYSLCMEGHLSLFSTGMAMLIQFKSNDKETEGGFKIEFKTVRRDKIITEGRVNNICSFRSVIRDTSGYIASPWFPTSLKKPIDCVWHVIGPKNKSLHLSYKMVGLVPKNLPGPIGKCNIDFVRHLFTPGNDVSDKQCGCQLPPNSKGPTGKELYIQMNSRTFGRVYHQPGFLIYHKTMDASSCPNAATCSAMNDDRDVGFDRHANIKYEKKDITTTPPPTQPPTESITEPIGPFRVQCYKDEMKIALNVTKFPSLVAETATLLDPNCKIYRRDANHVFIKTQLDGCRTYHNYSSDGRYIIYYNQINLQKKSTKPGDLITRDHLAVFEFECRYHRKMVMSVVHFTPARATVYTATENFGNFTFMMRMFKSKNYKEAYEKYPVYAVASKDLYVQTEVKAEDAELVLLVDKCHVTPSKDRNDKEFYDLIQKGCPVDETLEYNHKLSPVQQFNFKAFYFNVDKKATVHIHCTVRVCRKADKNSRCVKGCSYRRRRREVTDAEDDEITGQLTLGPVSLQEQSQTGNMSDSPKMFVEIVVGVLGFFVVVLLVAVMVVLMKKRQEPNKKHLSLMVENNEQ